MSFLILAVLVPALPGPALSASWNSVRQARTYQQVAVTNNLAQSEAPGQEIDFYKGSCKRKSQRSYRCNFRVAIIDSVWEGRGTLTYLGRRGYWRYDLKGREEACGPDGCQKSGTFHWKGGTGE